METTMEPDRRSRALPQPHPGLDRRSGTDRRKADRDELLCRWDQEPDQSPVLHPEQGAYSSR